MPSKETFTLYINSLTTPTIINTGVDNKSFNINWESVIPKKYKNRKFLVKSNFVSNVIYNVALLASGTISCSLGVSNMSDGANRNNVISLFRQQVHPFSSANQTAQNYISLPADNLPITMTYPTHNSLLVNVVNWDASAFDVHFISYMLVLSFTLVDEEPHSNSAENNSHGEYSSFIELTKSHI